MPNIGRTNSIVGILLCLALILSACGGDGGHNGHDASDPSGMKEAEGHQTPGDLPDPGQSAGREPEAPPETQDPAAEPDEPGPVDPAEVEYNVPENSYEAVEVVAEPASVTVLVNKKYALPRDYAPDDLVEPNVPFIFKEKLEKRKMRKEAAEALEALFAAAEEDGILLAGVSGYRSYNTQKGLYNWYVSRDGQEAADRYSARPGHSEHSTGLAMDVSGIDGKCAATDCFGDTKEAAWLAEHVYDYGFIIRYPEGKEDITGYKYEPWHLRYVGTEASREIRDLGLTLEEYTALKAAMASAVNGEATSGEGAGAPGGATDVDEIGASGEETETLLGERTEGDGQTDEPEPAGTNADSGNPGEGEDTSGEAVSDGIGFLRTDSLPA